MSIETIMNAMFSPPDPAPEVVTLDRVTVETILAELEAADPLRSIVSDLRGVLAAPKVELWAMRSIGPNEVFPALSREHADTMAAGLVAHGERIRQKMIERGESVEEWPEWRADVIPSPWEPVEHFQELASNADDEAAILRRHFKKADDDRSKLLDAAQALLAAPESLVALSGLQAAVVEVTAEEVAIRKRQADAEARHNANVERLHAEKEAKPK